MDEIRKLIPREQLARLQQKSAWRGTWMVVFNWGLIAASFALVIWHPGVASVLVAMFILGGRQLGLGILMHECAHRSLLPSRAANDWIGQWLCAAPMFLDLDVYRAYHMRHHIHTGTPDDPDLPNYAGYPVSPASFARKLLRDLTGLTGVRAFATLMVLYSHGDPKTVQFGYAYRRQATDDSTADARPAPRRLSHYVWNSRRNWLVQAIALGALCSLGHPLAYLLWPASWLTSHMLFSRIRNAAEHGGLPGTMTTDLWSNTRSIRARWWERLTVAPNFVNFHFEHHVLPTVPSYNLPGMHRCLRAEGALQRATVIHGYTTVVRSLIAKRTQSA